MTEKQAFDLLRRIRSAIQTVSSAGSSSGAFSRHLLPFLKELREIPDETEKPSTLKDPNLDEDLGF